MPACFALEQILQTELDHSARRCLADLAAGRLIHAAGRQEEIRMVGEVEHLRAELQPLSFTNLEKLLQGQVGLLHRRSGQAVSSRITERRQTACRRAAECSPVKPSVWSRIVDM